MHQKKQIILTFLIGLITALILLEVGLRIEGSFERLPLSARNYQSSKQESFYTILCLGNSYTRGIGAGYKENYPHQLQKLFDKETQQKKIRVINAGRSSQNSGELLDNLEYSLHKIKPDLVILQTGQPNFWNLNKYGKYLEKESVRQEPFRKFIFSSSDILYNSGVYRLSLLLMSKIKEKLHCLIINPDGFIDLHTKKIDAEVDWVRQLEKNYDNNLTCAIDPEKAKETATFFIKKAESNSRYAYFFYRNIGEIYFFQKRYKAAAEWFIKSIKAILKMDYNGSRDYLKYIYNNSKDADVDKLITGPEKEFIKFFGPDYNRSRDYLKYIYNNSSDREINKLIDRFENDFRNFLSKTHQGELFFTNDEVYKWLDSDFNEIIAIIRDKKVKVILQNFPPAENMAESREANLFNSVYLPGIAVKFNLPFVDNNRIFQEILKHGRKYTDIFSADGHCNAQGYKIMALNIFNKIKEEKIIEFNE